MKLFFDDRRGVVAFELDKVTENIEGFCRDMIRNGYFIRRLKNSAGKYVIEIRASGRAD